jgi:hypothetical protein
MAAVGRVLSDVALIGHRNSFRREVDIAPQKLLMRHKIPSKI